MKNFRVLTDFRVLTVLIEEQEESNWYSTSDSQWLFKMCPSVTAAFKTAEVSHNLGNTYASKHLHWQGYEFKSCKQKKKKRTPYLDLAAITLLFVSLFSLSTA